VISDEALGVTVPVGCAPVVTEQLVVFPLFVKTP
jgi:hypothetical protein